jgi:glycosyltransferase involved in cell wall biosynthesis
MTSLPSYRPVRHCELVMIEAMACGTPVNRGSLPEVVEHGTSGFVVDGEAKALAMLSRIGCLDRRQVRQAFERRDTALSPRLRRKCVRI